MIDIFENVITEKHAKNLNNVRPKKIKGWPKETKRRDILLERIEKNEVKKAKHEALEETRISNMRSKAQAV